MNGMDFADADAAMATEALGAVHEDGALPEDLQGPDEELDEVDAPGAEHTDRMQDDMQWGL